MPETPPPPTSPRRAEAERRLAARRRHVRAIRTRVAGLSVTVFLAASGAVVLQMVTGHDPGLAVASATSRETGAASTRTARAARTRTATTTATGTRDSGSSTTRPRDGSSTNHGSSPSAVTTRAS